jgi:hypothetical protein
MAEIDITADEFAELQGLPLHDITQSSITGDAVVLLLGEEEPYASVRVNIVFDDDDTAQLRASRGPNYEGAGD